MADEEKKPARKPRREALYTHDDSKKAREEKGGKKPEPKSEGASEKKPEASRGDAEMLKRHDNERRDMHNSQRSEHRAIDAEPGPEMMGKKMAAHRRHRTAMDELHGRHEKELMEKMNGPMEGEPAPKTEAQE